MSVRLLTEPTAPAPCRRHRRRRLRGAALLAAGAALVGTGAYSGWDASVSAGSSSVTAATVQAGLVDANGGQFTTAVGNLVPGDWFYRYVDVTNSGSGPSVFTGSVAVTGALAGQVAVEVTSCPVAWTTVGGVSTCSGSTPTALGSGTPTGSTTVTVAHGTIATTTPQHVRYRFTFSSTAPLSAQGQTGTISASVTNTVVAGSDRTGG